MWKAFLEMSDAIRSRRPPIRVDEIVVLAFYTLLFVVVWTVNGVHGSAVIRTLPIGVVVVFQYLLTFDLVLKGRGRFPRLGNVLRDWWPACIAPMGYETLRHLGAAEITVALGLSPKDELMLLADEKLFGAAAPLLIQWMVTDWLSHVLWFFYIFVYVLGPYVILAHFYFGQNNLSAFYETRLVIISTFLGGYLLYLLIPVAGPMALIPDQVQFQIAGGFGMKEMFEGTLRYKWDCFPSLHVAIPWAIVWVCFKHVPNWIRVTVVCSALAITLATIYLRFHWGIDVIAGLVWASVVYGVSMGIAKPGETELQG
jgi:membrane-associated phospholipid phosphatase